MALLLVYVFVIPILHGKALVMLSHFGIIIVTIGLVIAMVIFQIVLVQIFFLQDKLSPTDKHKPLALNNRKAFHCFNYFFFFYNVIMGISNCIMRLMTSIVVGTWLVSRIDRTIMQRGYENMDAGDFNLSWMNYVVLLVFTSMEKQTVCAYSTFHNTPSEKSVNSQARRRWALLYTLLRNPSLILHRKHHLSILGTLHTSPSVQSNTVLQASIMASQLHRRNAETPIPND
ncbi:stimulated by retinoic acid gene 6 protein-like [Stigmatopora nigra]